MHWENKYPKDWAIALTTTEFLLFNNFRQHLFARQPNNSYPYKHQFTFLTMVGNDTKPLRHFTSLIKQRHQFYANPKMIAGHGRSLHLNSIKYKYTTGRHSYAPELKPNSTGIEWNGFIVWWNWCPWPESFKRKVGVGETIPESDIKLKLGNQHTKRFQLNQSSNSELEKQLLNEKSLDLKSFLIEDLCSDPTHLNVIPKPKLPKSLIRRLDLLAFQRIFYGVTGNACGFM